MLLVFTAALIGKTMAVTASSLFSMKDTLRSPVFPGISQSTVNTVEYRSILRRRAEKITASAHEAGDGVAYWVICSAMSSRRYACSRVLSMLGLIFPKSYVLITKGSLVR